MPVTQLTRKGAADVLCQDEEVYLGYVLDESRSQTVSAGHYGNLKKRVSDGWIVACHGGPEVKPSLSGAPG